MRFCLYSIYDRKMNVYLAPFPARNNVEAVRNVSASFSDPQMKQTPVGQNPQDFDLVTIGDFDDESGEIVKSHPITITNVGDLAKSLSSTVPS